MKRLAVAPLDGVDVGGHAASAIPATIVADADEHRHVRVAVEALPEPNGPSSRCTTSAT